MFRTRVWAPSVVGQTHASQATDLDVLKDHVEVARILKCSRQVDDEGVVQPNQNTTLADHVVDLRAPREGGEGEEMV